MPKIRAKISRNLLRDNPARISTKIMIVFLMARKMTKRTEKQTMIQKKFRRKRMSPLSVPKKQLQSHHSQT